MNEQLSPKTVSVNGVELHYVERGAGEPLVLVHGSLNDYRSWMPQVEAFGQRYHVISYSRRYHTPNAWTGDGTDYTVSLHAQDLIALIEALELGPTHVVSNSFGAYTTLVTATRRPDLLRKLVIGEPPMLTWLKTIQGGQVYWDNFMEHAWLPATQAFKQGDMQQGVRLFLDGAIGLGTFDHLPEVVRQMMLSNARELAAETVAPDYFTELTPDQVSHINLPVLLLTGENSPHMFHLIVDQLAGCLPNARQATIPNTSHAMASGNPPVYNQTVLNFLQG